ncbi:hypothetical protein QBC38DRAFT_469019 [Podospora fimiseda]|uniref:Uncharacterized protein n=1 Tax=Podospora fimiseda TaxID=252190 RepID=A0AAN7BX27_9PEZI|nr:hypothetical protein QBC38DRAFT_469019 [Podospora fimiseda]
MSITYQDSFSTAPFPFEQQQQQQQLPSDEEEEGYHPTIFKGINWQQHTSTISSISQVSPRHISQQRQSTPEYHHHHHHPLVTHNSVPISQGNNNNHHHPNLFAVATRIHDICLVATRRYISSHPKEKRRRKSSNVSVSSQRTNRFRRSNDDDERRKQSRRERKQKERERRRQYSGPITRSRLKQARAQESMSSDDDVDDESLPGNIKLICSIIWETREKSTSDGLEAEHTALGKMQKVLEVAEGIWGVKVMNMEEAEEEEEEEGISGAMWEAVEDGRVLCEILGDEDGLKGVEEVWDWLVEGW